MIPRENFAAREIGKYFVRNACVKFSRLQQDSRVLANSRRCFIFFFLNEHERGEARIPIRFRALIYHRPVAVFTEIGENGYWQTSILFISL